MRALDALLGRSGYFGGTGLDHEERPFHGDLRIEPLPGEAGVAYAFAAVGIDGSPYRNERGWIAPHVEGRLALWCVSARSGVVRRLDLRHGAPAEGVTETWVFGDGDPADASVARIEVTFEVWPDGSVGYRVAEGPAGEPFLRLWSLRLTPGDSAT